MNCHWNFYCFFDICLNCNFSHRHREGETGFDLRWDIRRQRRFRWHGERLCLSHPHHLGQTIPYDGETFHLEYMDLDEFLLENEIPITLEEEELSKCLEAEWRGGDTQDPLMSRRLSHRCLRSNTRTMKTWGRLARCERWDDSRWDDKQACVLFLNHWYYKWQKHRPKMDGVMV